MRRVHVRGNYGRAPPAVDAAKTAAANESPLARAVIVCYYGGCTVDAYRTNDPADPYSYDADGYIAGFAWDGFPWGADTMCNFYGHMDADAVGKLSHAALADIGETPDRSGSSPTQIVSW